MRLLVILHILLIHLIRVTISLFVIANDLIHRMMAPFFPKR